MEDAEEQEAFVNHTNTRDRNEAQVNSASTITRAGKLK